MKLGLFCDFDETITRVNITDTVLERFAHPSWREIQEEWLAGGLSARAVLEKQMPLITVRQRDLDDFIDTIEVDASFADFASQCTEKGDSLYILSDGFDYWIERILKRSLAAWNGVPKEIPVFACSLTLRGEEAVISFPYFPQGCAHGCATCKPGLFEQLKASADKSIVIGDGVSDFLLAQSADLVLAKGALRQFCQREGMSCQAFDDFRDVIQILDAFRSRFREEDDD